MKIKMLLSCAAFVTFPLVFGSSAQAGIIRVESTTPDWHNQRILEPNTNYVLFPDPNARWQLSPISNEIDFHGERPINGLNIVGVNTNLQLGGLTALVWHHQPGGADAIAEIISFPLGREHATVRVGEEGGTIHFLIADLRRTHEDNSGTGVVRFEELDSQNFAYRPILPITARAEGGGATAWTINEAGEVTAAITYTVGSGSGSKKYMSAVVVEFFDGSAYTEQVQKTIGRPGFGSRNGTAHFSLPSIPAEKVSQIRRVYVRDWLNRGNNTPGEWIGSVVKILQEADAAYEELRENGLVQDAITYAAGAGG